MPKRIQVPNGEVWEFPDDASDDEVLSFVSSSLGGDASLAQEPSVQDQKKQSAWQWFLNSGFNPMNATSIIGRNIRENIQEPFYKAIGGKGELPTNEETAKAFAEPISETVGDFLNYGSTGKAAIKGAAELAVGTMLDSPSFLPVVGAGAVGGAATRIPVQALFSSEMGVGGAQQLKAAADAYSAGDKEEAARLATQGLLSLGMSTSLAAGETVAPAVRNRLEVGRAIRDVERATREELPQRAADIAAVEGMIPPRAGPREPVVKGINIIEQPNVAEATPVLRGEQLGAIQPVTRGTVREEPTGGKVGFRRVAEDIVAQPLEGKIERTAREVEEAGMPKTAEALKESTPEGQVNIQEIKPTEVTDAVKERQIEQGGIEQRAETDARGQTAETVGSNRTVEGGETKTPEEVKPPEITAFEQRLADRVKQEEASAQALGIVPPGIQRTIEIVQSLAKEEAAGAPGDLITTSGKAIPRPAEQSVLRSTVTRPEGAGKIPGLGWLFDKRYKGGDPINGAAITRDYIIRMGDSVKSIVRAALQKYDEAFKDLPISDVVEAYLRDPKSIKLKPEQVEAINAAKAYIDDVLDFMAEEGISRAEALRDFLANEAREGRTSANIYFPRAFKGKVQGPKTGGPPSKRSLSTTPSSLKERAYTTEAEGIADGAIYDSSFSRRVADHVNRAYHAVANRRFLDDPALGGVRIQDKIESAMESAFEPLDVLKKAIGNATSKAQERAMYERYVEMLDEFKKDYPDVYEEIRNDANSIHFGEQQIVGTGLSGRIFDAATARKIRKIMEPQEHQLVRWLNKFSGVSKSVQLALDWSAPLVQGLPLMWWSAATGRTTWARAAAASVKAMLNKDFMRDYINGNRDVITEFVQLGGSIGRLEDFMAEVGTGGVINRIPYVRAPFRVAGRGFGSFLDVSKIEMFKALKEVYPREEWKSLAETIEYVTGSARTQSIGMSKERMDTAQIALLAPNYYKSAPNLVAQAFSSGASGTVARQALGSFSVGVFATAIAGMKAAGLSNDEVIDKVKRMDFTVPVTIKGRKFNVGFGHILMSLSKLTANIARTAVDPDKSLVEGGVDSNPILRWLWAHSGPALSVGVETATGRDFLGQPVNAMESIKRRFTPLWLNQASETIKKGDTVAAVGDSLSSSIGINAWPMPYIQERRAEANRMSREKFGKDYDTLSIPQQFEIESVLSKSDKFSRNPEEVSPRTLLAANEWDKKKRDRIYAALGEDAKSLLDFVGIRPSAYDSKFSYYGTRVPMSEEQQLAYEAYVIQAYDEILPRFTKDIQSLPIYQRAKALQDKMQAARKRAASLFLQDEQKRSQGSRQ